MRMPSHQLAPTDVAFVGVEAILGGHHLVPLRLKRGITLLKHEPSGQMPWQKTMLGLVFVDVFILEPP